MDIATLTRREQPALGLAPSGPITTLRFVGRDDDPLDLPPTRARFTIGADDCDLVIPRDLSRAVSPVHAILDRFDTGLVLHDRGSRNGSFASLAGPRRASLHVEPGDTFWIADVALLATDLLLEALRAHLACHLGLDPHAAVDAAVATIASGRPLLLLGAPGTGARRLAHVIHATSPRRDNPFLDGVPPAYLAHHAHATTVFVDLDHQPAPSAREAAALFDPALGVCAIFATSDEGRARARLDHHRDRVHALHLTPLARRPDDVLHVLQFHWATSLSSCHLVSELGPRALHALTTYPWPRNLDELLDHSPRILAYHHHRSLRRAAAALGITHQSLSGHFARLGFPAFGHLIRARVGL